MDIERTIKMVLAQLSLDEIKLEEDLERTINCDMDASSKIHEIKKILEQMVLTNASLHKFAGMMKQNNNAQTTENNGKDN